MEVETQAGMYVWFLTSLNMMQQASTSSGPKCKGKPPLKIQKQRKKRLLLLGESHLSELCGSSEALRLDWYGMPRLSEGRGEYWTERERWRCTTNASSVVKGGERVRLTCVERFPFSDHKTVGLNMNCDFYHHPDLSCQIVSWVLLHSCHLWRD